MENIKDRCLQSIGWKETMMGTKNTTFIIAPSFYQNNAALKEMIFTIKAINLHTGSIRNVKFLEGSTESTPYSILFKEVMEPLECRHAILWILEVCNYAQKRIQWNDFHGVSRYKSKECSHKNVNMHSPMHTKYIYYVQKKFISNTTKTKRSHKFKMFFLWKDRKSVV